MAAVVGEDGERLPGHRFELDDRDSLVGYAIRIVAEHPSTIGIPRPAIHIYVRLADAVTDSCRLKVRLRLSDRTQHRIFELLNVLGASPCGVPFNRFGVGTDCRCRMGVYRREDDVVAGNRRLPCDPFRYLLPQSSGNTDHFTRDERSLVRAI